MPGVIFCVRRAGIRIQPGFIYKVHVYNGGFVGRRNGIWPTWGTGYCRWKYVGTYAFVGIASAAVGGAAVLLIRLCTLWFGLGLGLIALLFYRTTQLVDHSSEQGERLDMKKLEMKSTSSEDADRPDSQKDPASTATGDKVR